MKANNLTISVPNMGCNKNCPYCVSKCTGAMKSDSSLMLRNFQKILNLSRMSQVSSVLITGKGEPCLNMGSVLDFTHKFKEFPLELQTNGFFLGENLGFILELAQTGMNVIAISVDNLDPDFERRPDLKLLSESIHKAGMLMRVCFNITSETYLRRRTCPEGISFEDILYMAKLWGTDQFTLRKIVAPNNTEETLQSKWIAHNCDPSFYARLVNEMKRKCQEEGHHIRSLPYGAEVFDLQGISVSYSDYCIQDDNNTEDIRSLIFQEDGHVYSSWSSRASCLF
jgi:hypothetical protein